LKTPRALVLKKYLITAADFAYFLIVQTFFFSKARVRSRATLSLRRSHVLDARSVISADEKEYLRRVVMSSPPPSPNAKLERAYTAAKDREKIEIAKSGLQSEAAQGNIAVVLERLLNLDQRVDPRDVPTVYKRALLRFHPDRHVGKPIAKRASYEERYEIYY
jgi:hypothetical protein